MSDKYWPDEMYQSLLAERDLLLVTARKRELAHHREKKLLLAIRDAAINCCPDCDVGCQLCKALEAWDNREREEG